MTNVRARLRMWIYACVAGAVLTGCGATDDGDRRETGGGNGTDGENSESPLSEYLGEGFEMSAGGMMVQISGAEITDDEKQQMRKVEDLIASCMDESGFEYVPVSPDDAGSSEFDEAFSMDPAGFAEKYGYGVSTMQAEVSASDGDGEGEEKDPNQEIRDGLSAGAQKEYDKALWGEQADLAGSGGAAVAPAHPPEETDPDEQGCQQSASNEVFGEQQAGMDSDEFGKLFEDIGTLQERIGTDPDVAEAETEWAACMAAESHGEFSTLDEPMQEVIDRWTKLQGGEQSGGPANNLTVNGEGAQPDVDPAELEKLQQYEIDVATADHGCQQDGYQETYNEVSHELEEQFVEQHRDELERYRDAMAGSGSGDAGGVG